MSPSFSWVHDPRGERRLAARKGERRMEIFSGKVLSTLFGDDVKPNGTPINFGEEDPFLSEEEEGNVAVKAKSHEAGTEE